MSFFKRHYEKEPGELVKMLNEKQIPSDKDIMIYDDIFGAIASRVGWTLEWLGYRNVTLFPITFSGWLAWSILMSSTYKTSGQIFF